MTPNPSSGIVTQKSFHSVDETVRRLEQTLGIRQLKLFAIVDHSGEAAGVGLNMPNTKLVLFGHAKAGTPIMLASPSAAIDLPLKILVSEDGDGTVWVTYNSPSYLQARHGFPQPLEGNIAGVKDLASIAGSE